MPNLVSMKRTPQEKKDLEAPSSPDAEEFPWGLKLSLDAEDLDKLGLIPTVGEEVIISAVAKVTDAHISESEDDGKRRSAGLQITSMGISNKADEKSASEKIYG